MRGLEDIIRQNREVAELGGKVGDLQLPVGVGGFKTFHEAQYEHEQTVKAAGECTCANEAQYASCPVCSVSDKQDAMEQILLNKLPHGSGINCKWEFVWLKNGKVKAKNAFHCMNDVGYYDGYADFTVIIPPKDHTEFKLVFNGRQGQNKNRQYLLRDYLEDTLYQALQEKGG